MPRSRTWSTTVGLLVATGLVLGATSSAAPPTGPAKVGKLFDGSETECRRTTWLQTDTPGDAYRVPGNGVIVRMRARTTSAGVGQSLRFKVARLDPVEDFWRIVAETGSVSIPEGTTTVEKATRIRVRTGDVIGFSFPNLTEVVCARPASADFHYTFDAGDVAPGELMQGISSDLVQFAVQALVEPDADRDGFGDLTQDRCPTDPTTSKPCATSRPQTTITSSAAAGRRVTFRFRADEEATFRCRVDDGRRRPCVSPKTFELSRGRHTLRVVATDRYGNTDATPATRTVVLP